MLPVRLLEFSAISQQNNALLTWRTTNEQNMSRYNIQRSLNGKSFITIGSTTVKNLFSNYYTYTDFNIDQYHTNKIYYRLQQVDNDGKQSVSKTEIITISNKTNLIVSPNPFTNKLQLSVASDNETTAIVTITNMTGAVMVNNKVNLSSGTNTLNYKTASWPSGEYIVKLQPMNGDNKSIKVVKE